MIEIKDLLSKFTDTLLKEEIKIESIRSIISKAINLEIKKEDIKIEKNIIYLNIKPIYKNEIFLHQEEITTAIQESLGKKAPKNFR